MDVLKAFDNGYTRLVPVIPPDATLSPASTVAPGMRGKAPGRKNARGEWSGFPKWFDHRATREDVAQWVASGANIGMIAEDFPALDIDVTEEWLADAVEAIAHDFFGSPFAPVRYGRAPKRLLLYRQGQGAKVREKRLKIRRKGTEQWHLVEWLAGPKRQYLIAGTHPSGAPYRWTMDGPDTEQPIGPDSTAPAALMTVDDDSANSFFNLLKERLGERYEFMDGTSRGEHEAPPQDDLVAPSIKGLRSVVESIPNDDEHSPDREHYLAMAYAIKAAAGDDEDSGREIFYAWAGSRTPDERVSGNPETWESDWRRCHPPYRIGYQWLLDQCPTSAQEEFEADPTLAYDPLPADLDEDVLLGLIAEDLRPMLRFNEAKKWCEWDGTRWGLCDSVPLHRIAQSCARLAERIMGKVPVVTKEEAAQLTRVAKKLRTLRFTEQVERHLRGPLWIAADAFDADGWLLNTPAGVVDLRNGVLREHDASDMLMQCTSVAPERGPAPEWDRFLDEATGGDRELRQWLQKFAGYALTGHTHEQVLVFVWGPGGTGKSVFVDALMRAVGDYARHAAMTTFATSRGDAHPTEIAHLYGARIVSARETQVGRRWDEARIKNITGGEPIAARFIGKDFFVFEPRFALLLVGNHPPALAVADDAMKRRLRVVPFTHKPVVVDRFLGDKLKGEAPQILQWMIDGCLRWQAEGLGSVAAVEAQTTEYFAEEDPIQLWLNECTEESDDFTPLLDLYRSWQQWAHQQGEEPGTNKFLARRLAEKLGRKNRVQWVNGKATRVFDGITLSRIDEEV